MTTSRVIICNSCANYMPPSMATGSGPTCSSFPDGIPANIQAGADHRESISGEPAWRRHPLNGHLLRSYERMVEVRDAG